MSLQDVTLTSKAQNLSGENPDWLVGRTLDEAPPRADEEVASVATQRLDARVTVSIEKHR